MPGFFLEGKPSNGALSIDAPPTVEDESADLDDEDTLELKALAPPSSDSPLPLHDESQPGTLETEQDPAPSRIVTLEASAAPDVSPEHQLPAEQRAELAEQDTVEQPAQAFTQNGTLAEQDTQEQPAQPLEEGNALAEQDTVEQPALHPDESSELAEQNTQEQPVQQSSNDADPAAQDTQEQPAQQDDGRAALAAQETLEGAAKGTRAGGHSGRKRRQRKGHATLQKLLRPRTTRERVLSLVLLALVLIGVLVPGIVGISYAVRAYATYSTLSSSAHGGVQHLMNLKTIFNGVKSHPTGLLDTGKLRHAQGELNAAQQDFLQLQNTLDSSDIVHFVTDTFTQYRRQVSAARSASQIGIDATIIGQRLVSTALVLAPSFRGPLFTSNSKPLVTQPMLNLVGQTVSEILPYLRDIQAQSQRFSLNDLPVNISASQREQVTQLFDILPQVISDLTQTQELLGAAGWLLGVDAPRTFLVQTMDRAELRPSGGFTGQYGELHINSGRVGDFSLRDISLLEYVDNSPTIGQQAPPAYRSWWPFANFGLRDSNLSADFPTTAQIAISLYKHESHQDVDGVVLFTPMLIEHVLDVIGPINLPQYNEVITSQNLEDRLHYYQQDNTGIRKQELVQHISPPAQARKLFTALLAHTLMDTVRHAPPDELLAIAREALHDLKTKDLQLYFTNPQAEALLLHYGFAGAMDRSPDHDGLYVVQADLNATKASQYTRSVLHDVVTLHTDGSATHVLQLRLVSTQTGPVYGYDAYRDYVRVYVPPGSRFLWGDGFDTGVPLCGAQTVACPQNSVYPRDQLVCPPGQYQPGAASPSLADEDGGRWHPLDTIGPPMTMQSDEPGRAMFGGWVVVPKNCTMTVTLSWYVPPRGQHPYALLVQRQAGSFPELDLTILPTPGTCSALRTSGMHFDGLLTEDAYFPLKTFRPTVNSGQSCYPQSGV